VQYRRACVCVRACVWDVGWGGVGGSCTRLVACSGLKIVGKDIFSQAVKGALRQGGGCMHRATAAAAVVLAVVVVVVVVVV
jgi:hypothetical protein